MYLNKILEYISSKLNKFKNLKKAHLFLQIIIPKSNINE